MRIVESEFESYEYSTEYNFQNNILCNIKSEPFSLRHEYYELEKEIKQSLYLFGRRKEEHGSQVFIHSYKNYSTNDLYIGDLKFYLLQLGKFKLSNGVTVSNNFLLPKITGLLNNQQILAKDGRYRKRIVYNLQGQKNALLIVYSLDSNNFIENQFFKYVENNFLITIE